MSKFYITTPIYYVNDKPHIGHAYTTIAADVIARWYRMKGADTFFLTGTDENSQKSLEAAEKKEEQLQAYVDAMSATWQQTFDSLDIINNDFIRTTEDRHKVGVDKFFKAVYDRGDIYKGTYKGLYCVGCESFVTEADLIDGKCPIHKTEPKEIEEENYFFKASAYKDKLLKHIKDNPEFIQPKARRNEVVSYIKDHFVDISISRQSLKWGIPLPIDESQVIYVWFDALINYLTGIGYGTDNKMFSKYWPADLHIVGKDIIKFHCALWPAMLMSAGLPLPKQVFAHGFFTINGEKISKSLGNAIDPVEIVNKYNNDTLRYFLLREIPFGSDGDFSQTRLAERYESDLANGIGNLAARTLGMTEKYFDSLVPVGESAGKIKKATAAAWKKYEKSVETLSFHTALEEVNKLVKVCDTYVEESKPWELAKLEDKAKLAKAIYSLLEGIRHIAWMIYPFMPATAENLIDQLGDKDAFSSLTLADAQKWGTLLPGHSVKKGDALFPRLS